MQIQVVKRFTREKNLTLKLLTKSEGDTDKLGRFEVVKIFFTVSAADLIKALRELESGEGDIEQTITIVPNPRAKRRGSMASYAFPELHSR